MCNSDDVWEQVGITSTGDGCARPLLPGVYTRVAAYQSWINATMNSSNHVSVISHTIFISLVFIIFF
jgi:secreted trypsin-like serine protease